MVLLDEIGELIILANKFIRCSNCNDKTTDLYIGSKCDHYICAKCFSLKFINKYKKCVCEKCPDSQLKKYDTYKEIYYELNLLVDHINSSDSHTTYANNLHSTLLDDKTLIDHIEKINVDNIECMANDDNFADIKVDNINNTQLSLLYNKSINIESFDSNEKSEILAMFLKRMSVSDIYKTLSTSMEESSLKILISQLNNDHSNITTIIPETDPEDDIDNNTVTNFETYFHKEHNNMILTNSRLKSCYTTYYEQFLNRFNVKSFKKINTNCTHLIMITDQNNHITRTEYTFKYIFAIVSQMYILSYKWIIDSLSKNILLNELPYLVKGDITFSESLTPYKSINSKLRLFHNTIFFLLTDANTLFFSQSQFIDVLNAAHGVVKCDTRFIDTYIHNYNLRYAIISNMDFVIDEFNQNLFTKYQIKSVTIDNILNSIYSYTIP